MAVVPTEALAVAVADDADATAATADEAPATPDDAVPAADIAIDCTTAVLQLKKERGKNMEESAGETL